MLGMDEFPSVFIQSDEAKEQLHIPFKYVCACVYFFVWYIHFVMHAQSYYDVPNFSRFKVIVSPIKVWLAWSF